MTKIGMFDDKFATEGIAKTYCLP